MNYPWWLRCIVAGAGVALVAAIFADVIFGLGRIVLPLSDQTFERWVDDPPVVALFLIVWLLASVFEFGWELGRRGRTD